MWDNIEFIKSIVKISFNKSDVLKSLGLKNNGGNFNTLSNFLIRNDIDISHFKFGVPKNGHPISLYKKLDLSDILINGSTFKSNHLKKRLYKEGLKVSICELCGQDENWEGKRMSLILDHINGNRYDNRIENLRIVCPNCNATLETHCRGNKVYDKSNNKKTHNICECGEIKKVKSKKCKKCYSNRNPNIKITKSRTQLRKVQRPSYTQLSLEVNEIGYVATGKKYGVSDNSIRKWIRMYKKYGENF